MKTIFECERLYYIVRVSELKNLIKEYEVRLDEINRQDLVRRFTEFSMRLLKGHLSEYFGSFKRMTFEDDSDIKWESEAFVRNYPVVTSTTFSARSCLDNDFLFDYVIMDEASQVSIETGFLALTVAKNAVIVGDTKQLPNVIKDEDREKLERIKNELNRISGEFKVKECYDCSRHSFLSSIISARKDIPATMLREHYRCHPRIIGFCNQMYYNNQLVIMTEDRNENSVLNEITTNGVHNKKYKFNQREIDVIKEEIESINSSSNAVTYDLGVITPYREQADKLQKQMDGVESDTVHKFQGREKDIVMFSVVDDKISDFADNPNLLNVAVSRAKDRFYLVLTGNRQKKRGNIYNLQQYIRYNRGECKRSGLKSIFDYLNTNRLKIDAKYRISDFDSENVTYKLILDIIGRIGAYSHLGVTPHYGLLQLVKDTSRLSDEEIKYISNPATHIDFLISNKVSKEAVLAVETDGYGFHNEETQQHSRDILKDSILENMRYRY